MSLKETMMVSMATNSVMEVLKQLNPDRTVGSITKKEVKKIIKDMIKGKDLSDMMK